MKRAGDDVAWEHKDRGIEISNIAVVEAARCLNLVFRISEFAILYKIV